MNLGISKKLNYNLYSNEERAQQVKDLFTPEVEQLAKDHYTEASTQKELETAANFILYGKDPKNDKNFCQKKEIQIDAKHTTWKTKEPESLDALMEDPMTDQTQFQEVRKNSYKKPKPTIDREKDKNIPGMQDLWNAIDKLAEEVKEYKDKKQLGLDFYRKNHLLIQLRKEQFALKDSETEQIHCHSFMGSSTPDTCFTSDTGYLRDHYTDWVYKCWRADHYRKDFGENWYAKEQEQIAKQLSEGAINNWEWVEVSKNEIDFTNSDHVYKVLEMYATLKEYSWENLNSDLKFLIWELEDYIEQANLSEARRHILIRKIDRATNETIARELQEQFGLAYSDNYISTIYKQMICDKIAKTAQLSLDNYIYRNQPEKFKVCSTCGTKLLRDSRNFIKKQNSKDGLSARCKMCDKEIRDRKKEEKINEK